jgi:hypothetical protein
MRWRTKAEVVSGKGQFMCAAKRCYNEEDLHSYEVPFRYQEQGETKAELVKVRVCVGCAKKLFYDKIKELLREKRQRKRRRTELGAGDATDSTNCSKKKATEYDEEDDDDFASVNPSHEAILQLLAQDRGLAESKGNDDDDQEDAKGSRHGGQISNNIPIHDKSTSRSDDRARYDFSDLLL